MSYIKKKYQKWNDELFNLTKFKLGSRIDDFKELIPAENVNEYTTVGEIPWLIVVNDNKEIIQICYRNIFPILEEKLWDLPINEFVEYMGKVFETALGEVITKS